MCVGSNLCCAIAVYFLAYFLASIIGHIVVATCLWIIRRLSLKAQNRPPFSEWGSFFFGATERAVALTLVLMAPAYLPAFIGGWVVLKFAIGWQRQQLQPSLFEEDTRQVATQSFVALIGSVISFAIPIAVGLFLYPEALNAWATRK
jgi:hypothetical protein